MLINFNIPRKVQLLIMQINDVKIGNLYCPPNVYIKIAQYTRILDSLRYRYIIMGDFNAQNRIWGSSQDNDKGKTPAEAINRECHHSQ